DASFRGLDVVSKKVIWASGTGGTVIRTIDGGSNWGVIKVPGASKLDFRDIEAFDSRTAYVLSIGNGDSSRIYKTSDGGATWKLQFKNELKDAFFDSIAFWDEDHGLAQSDPIDGKYVFYETKDGETWTRMPAERMPVALEGEAAFAASGTCIVTRGENEVFLITGGKAAHVYHSSNRGQTWSSVPAPLIYGGQGTGIFGFAYMGKRAIIVGGDYTKPKQNDRTVAYSMDKGKSWATKYKLAPFGYRSGATFVKKKTIVVVGITGSNISYDAGDSWEELDKVERNTVMSKGNKAVWAVGPKGEVSKLRIK
ncbi:MAG: glycosyl hydrolase, partial [Pyrinomonadaceae bacterium]|nr:glycosyl hydrolase [Pyrinomonadaceae bacterium]